MTIMKIHIFLRSFVKSEPTVISHVKKVLLLNDRLFANTSQKIVDLMCSVSKVAYNYCREQTSRLFQALLCGVFLNVHDLSQLLPQIFE